MGHHADYPKCPAEKGGSSVNKEGIVTTTTDSTGGGTVVTRSTEG